MNLHTSSDKATLVDNLLHFQIIIFTPKEIELPDVPTPAPAVISPVAFSSTVIFRS